MSSTFTLSLLLLQCVPERPGESGIVVGARDVLDLGQIEDDEVALRHAALGDVMVGDLPRLGHVLVHNQPHVRRFQGRRTRCQEDNWKNENRTHGCTYKLCCWKKSQIRSVALIRSDGGPAMRIELPFSTCPVMAQAINRHDLEPHRPRIALDPNAVAVGLCSWDSRAAERTRRRSRVSDTGGRRT